MEKDDLFRLAVQMAGSNLSIGALAAADRNKEVSVMIRIAYNAILDAYSKLPERGTASLD